MENMEENNNEVLDNTSVETTTETGEVETTKNETVEDTKVEVPENNGKTYTQEDVDAIVKSRISREKKIYERKEARLKNALKAGMGVDNDDELTDKVVEYYKGQGIDIPEEPTYSEDDERILADYEAKAIESLGLDEVRSVTEDMESRLNTLSKREKLMYEALNTYKTNEESKLELRKIGVKDDVLNSEDFKSFASKFNSGVPITDVYSLYARTKEQEVTPIGDMSTSGNKEIKNYYTPEEYDRLSPEEKKDPAIQKIVEDSMFGITGKAWTS